MTYLSQRRLKPTKVALLRLASAAEEIEKYAAHVYGCPAIAAKGECDCGLDDAERQYRLKRADAGLSLDGTPSPEDPVRRQLEEMARDKRYSDAQVGIGFRRALAANEV